MFRPSFTLLSTAAMALERTDTRPRGDQRIVNNRGKGLITSLFPFQTPTTIAKGPHNDTSERVFKIRGAPEADERE